MAAITGMLCQIITGKMSGAGTDGRVYVGLGGREFRIDSKADDYEAGSWREYVLGDMGGSGTTPVLNPSWNDPRKGFPIDTVNLGKSPVYVRFEPDGDDDNWNLYFAAVLVYIGQRQYYTGYAPPPEFNNLWMGDRSGKILYLTAEYPANPQMLLKIGRELAKSGKRPKKQ